MSGTEDCEWPHDFGEIELCVLLLADVDDEAMVGSSGRPRCREGEVECVEKRWVE